MAEEQEGEDGDEQEEEDTTNATSPAAVVFSLHRWGNVNCLPQIIWSRRQSKKKAGPSHPLPPPPPLRATSPPEAGENGGAVSVVKGKKKAGGARLWMRFDRFGNSELVECDKNAILKRVAIPARDLRILGPVFSHSSSILAREKAMVVNFGVHKGFSHCRGSIDFGSPETRGSSVCRSAKATAST